MSLQELLAKRAELEARMQTLADADTLNEVQEKEWGEIENEIKALDNKIKRMQAAAAAASAGQLATAQAASTSAAPALVSPPANTGLSQQDERDISGVSFMRMAAAARDPRIVLDGVEAEMSQQASNEARDAGAPLDGGAVGIPQVALEAGRMSRPQNNHTATGGTNGDQGGVLIETEVRPFIEILMEAIQLRSLGVTFLSGLQGNIRFPRAIRSIARPTAKAENATADELTVTFGSFELKPRRIPAFLKLSDQLLRQQSNAVENWFRQYIATEIALKMDDLALNGDGTGDNPTGLLNTTGINIGNLGANGGAITRDALIDMDTRLKEAKARRGNWSYLITPGTEGKLKKTKIEPGAVDTVIDRRTPGMIEDHMYQYSHFLPTNGTKGTGTGLHSAILGKWSSMLLGQWGGIELMSDPYTGIKEDLVTIVGRTYMDVGVEHPEEFEVLNDIDLTL